MSDDLTIREVLVDIAAYRDRITVAEMNLDNLPLSADDYRVRKKIIQKRRQYEMEIKHVRNLIRIAKSVIDKGFAVPSL
jgi:hypothetical protein